MIERGIKWGDEQRRGFYRKDAKAAKGRGGEMGLAAKGRKKRKEKGWAV